MGAVCLYIECRLQKRPYLLIDFADALKTNLYKLGSVYVKLVKFLHWEKKIPLLDPSLYIHRFCAKLEFEEKVHEVTTTALRLLQSMKRDWICTGRRPNGLCGAAILCAARIHKFKRSTHQVIRAVNVCHETIRKRIDEFSRTSVAALTEAEFEQKKNSLEDVGDPMDPPAFIRRMLPKKVP